MADLLFFLRKVSVESEQDLFALQGMAYVICVSTTLIR